MEIATQSKKDIDPLDIALSALSEESKDAITQRVEDSGVLPDRSALQGVPKMRYTEAQVLEAVRKSGGSMSKVAKILAKTDNSKCAWYTADRAVAKYPAARELFEGLRQKLIDDAEKCVHKAIKGGDVGAAQYILSTVGKDRGFSTRKEIEHKGQHVHLIISPDESEV